MVGNINSFKASRHGRYRKLLLDPQNLLPAAQNLEVLFNTLDHKRQQGILSDAEFLSYGLFTLLACRRPDAFQSNKTKCKDSIEKESTPLKPESTDFILSDLWNLLCENNLPVSGNKKILDQKLSVYQFLNRVRFRGIPDSARMALLAWLNHQYPLILMFHVPSAAEVFELQKQGGRCTTFFKQAPELTELHHGRDAISFIVHDLIHAHEFYSLPQRAQQQIGFYHWLDNIKNNPDLLKLQAESDEFLERWEYVLSDMNSYCGHLLKTLHAAFTNYEKSIHAPAGEGGLFWNNVVDTSDLEEREKILFRKINSAAWNEADFLHLELIFERWSHTPTLASSMKNQD